MRSLATLLATLFLALSASAQQGPEEWVWGTSTGAGGLRSFAAVQTELDVTGVGTNTWYDIDESTMLESRGDWSQSSGVVTYGASTDAPTIKVFISAKTSAVLNRTGGTTTCQSRLQVLLDPTGSAGFSEVIQDAWNQIWTPSFCFIGCTWYFSNMGGVTIREIQDGGKIKTQIWSSCAPSTNLLIDVPDSTSGGSQIVVMEVE